MDCKRITHWISLNLFVVFNCSSEDIGRAHLYFCHCELALDLTERCRKTLMEQLLTTLNIHIFVKTMKAPLLVCVSFYYSDFLTWNLVSFDPQISVYIHDYILISFLWTQHFHFPAFESNFLLNVDYKLVLI